MTYLLGIRWTIGDVSTAGFEALRLSIIGAMRLFGSRARYAVYVNTVPVAEAQRKCGPVATEIEWRDANGQVPAWLGPHLGPGFAAGVAWKLAPLRAFPELHELALDNDVILWKLPTAMLRWLAARDTCLVGEDVRASFGQFSELCGSDPRDLGIRGLPPHFDFGRAIRAVLARHPVGLTSELDEQGLQLAALHGSAIEVVPLEDVTVCSPFWPHVPYLGRCGAHFSGLNARTLGWSLDDYPAEMYVRKHWQRYHDEVATRVGAAGPAPLGGAAMGSTA
ncbi:MAG TPA: hypothetical protein VML75_23670 [Kofleriaceae bacterium]|nr:hypothetical protein [Kofleriaceae bacterium]